MSGVKVPSYRLHKPTRQAIVTIAGKMHYLGEWGSQESKREYRRLLRKLLDCEPDQLAENLVGDPSLTIDELISRSQ